jgi:hypothetical protein
MSMDQVKFLFHGVLPALDDMTVVDIGSRLGVVLYGVSPISQMPHARWVCVGLFSHLTC